MTRCTGTLENSEEFVVGELIADFAVVIFHQIYGYTLAEALRLQVKDNILCLSEKTTKHCIFTIQTGRNFSA